jgi:hypothetical protein
MTCRTKCLAAVLLALVTFAVDFSRATAECIPFDQARRHIGETECVTGRVLRVKNGTAGVHYLDFCDDYRLCPFSVVVFSYDLKNVGDVRELAGKLVEVRGEVKEYDGRAEIVLESRRQLTGEAANIPPLPKNFDVEQRGKFSPGQFRAPHSRSTRRKKGNPTLPVTLPEEGDE